MEQILYSGSKDMVRFLLAFCCKDNSSTTPVTADEVLGKHFEDCLRKVIPVANSDGMRQRLDG